MKKFIGAIIGAIGTVISYFISFSLNADKDNIIISLGLHGYKTLLLTFGITGAIFLGVFVLSLAYGIFKTVSLKKTTEAVESEFKEAIIAERKIKERQTSYLSADGELSEQIIRKHLKSAYDNEWKNLYPELALLYEQSVKMDDLQRRLNELITKNGAEILDDAKDALVAAEQGMLSNIRKVLNYISVCDVKEEKGVTKVRDEANIASEQNNIILGKVEDLLMALTEYLNNQDDNKDDLSLINEYKNALSGLGSESTAEDMTLPYTKA